MAFEPPVGKEQMSGKQFIDPELYEGLQAFTQLTTKKLLTLVPRPEPASPTKEDFEADEYGDDIAPEWRANIKTILFNEEQIALRVRQLGHEISNDYRGKKIVAVGLLKGGLMIMADLLRHLSVRYEIDFMVVSSYQGTQSTGNVRVKRDLSVDPYGKHVLVVEDLIDTGRTLHWIREYLIAKGCASVKLACLLDKKERRTCDVHVDYVGYECPDEFVVGYGMDFNGEYRCMPFVGVLKPEAYIS